MGNCKLCGKESGTLSICNECRTNLYREKVSPKNTCKICGKPTDNPKLCDDCLANVLKDYKSNANELQTVERDILTTPEIKSNAEYSIIDDKPQNTPIINATYVKPSEPLNQTININVPASTVPNAQNVYVGQNAQGSRRGCECCGNPNFRSEIVIVRAFSLKKFLLMLFAAFLTIIIGVLIMNFGGSDISFIIGIIINCIGMLVGVSSLSAFWAKRKFKKLVCTNCGHIQD